MSFQKMYGLRGPSGLNMVNQAFIIVIAYRPRRRKIPGIGRYPMGPTTSTFAFLIVSVSKLMIKIGIMILKPLKYVQGYAQRLKW